RAAAGDPRTDLGLHLLLHAVLERVHLRAHLPAIDPEQDGAGRDRERIRRRRHLSLGLADGGRAGRLAAAGDPLRLLRRALRVGDDGRGKGISAPARANQETSGVYACTFWFWARPAWSAASWSNACCVTAASARPTSPS